MSDSDFFIGDFVILQSLSKPSNAFGGDLEAMSNSAIGKVCMIDQEYQDGSYKVRYVVLEKDNVGDISLIAASEDLVFVPPSEELLLLYSEKLRDLVAPDGRLDKAHPTYLKLVEKFGLSL